MSSYDVSEELAVLESIYCLPGEIIIHTAGSDASCDTVFTVTLGATRLTLTVPSSYPHVAPSVAVSSDVKSRDTCCHVTQRLSAHALSLSGRPMLLDLVMWLQDDLDQNSDPTRQVSKGQEEEANIDAETKERDVTASDCCVALLRLDHMRKRTVYCKTLTEWARELGVVGRVLFRDRLILILLIGQTTYIKELIVRIRTVNVDVDSRGKACKERMMSVLSEPHPINSISHSSIVKEFKCVELRNHLELEQFFTDYNLQQLYNDHVSTLMKASS